MVFHPNSKRGETSRRARAPSVREPKMPEGSRQLTGRSRALQRTSGLKLRGNRTSRGFWPGGGRSGRSAGNGRLRRVGGGRAAGLGRAARRRSGARGAGRSGFARGGRVGGGIRRERDVDRGVVPGTTGPREASEDQQRDDQACAPNHEGEHTPNVGSVTLRDLGTERARLGALVEVGHARAERSACSSYHQGSPGEGGERRRTTSRAAAASFAICARSASRPGNRCSPRRRARR